VALRGVLFDLDDTLADSAGIEQRVWLDVVELIAERHPAVERTRLRERYVGVLESHYTDLAAGITDFLTYRRSRLEDALSPWGGVDDDLFERYVEVKNRCIDEVAAAEGAIEVVRELRERGLRVGILTNGPSWMQRRKLEVSGLGAEVDAVAISGEIGAAKPDRAAFTCALALLGTNADETAMIGDSLANDVEGALAAGLAPVVWVNPHAEPPPGAVATRDLAGVPSLLGLA
jgi:putative hydrolase of the HAD superfamily